MPEALAAAAVLPAFLASLSFRSLLVTLSKWQEKMNPIRGVIASAHFSGMIYLLRWNSCSRRNSTRLARADRNDADHKFPHWQVSCFVSGSTTYSNSHGWRMAKAHPTNQFMHELHGEIGISFIRLHQLNDVLQIDEDTLSAKSIIIISSLTFVFVMYFSTCSA